MANVIKQTVPIILLFGFWLIACFCEGSYTFVCTDDNNKNTTFVPADGVVKGRYILTWCTDIRENDTLWNIHIFYNTKDRKACTPFSLRSKHSTKSVNISYEEINCGHVCLSTEFDLIFSTCYHIQNWFPSRGTMRDVSVINITNEYNYDTFDKSRAGGNIVNHGSYVTAHIYLGNISVSTFEVQNCRLVNYTYYEIWSCGDVTSNCSKDASPRQNEVHCHVATTDGSYELRLVHYGPWRGGYAATKAYARLRYNVTHENGLGEIVVQKTTWFWTWTSLGLLALIILLLTIHCWQSTKFRNDVQQAWLSRERNKQTVVEGLGEGNGPVVLLYASEGPAAEPLVKSLVRLLQTSTPVKVYDIYDPETVAEGAADFSTWLRTLLAREDVRVVLLQSPALLAHMAVTPGDTRHALEQPLLGGRLQYRQPQAAHCALPLALKLLPTHGYRRLHVVQLENLEIEAVPHLVPYRRYVLPKHCATLLNDLQPTSDPPTSDPPTSDPPTSDPPTSAPPTSAPPTSDIHLSEMTLTPTKQHQQLLVDQLAEAVQQFVEFVRLNTTYLSDELMAIN